jgi:hypothetical protein
MARELRLSDEHLRVNLLVEREMTLPPSVYELFGIPRAVFGFFQRNFNERGSRNPRWTPKTGN